MTGPLFAFAAVACVLGLLAASLSLRRRLPPGLAPLIEQTGREEERPGRGVRAERAAERLLDRLLGPLVPGGYGHRLRALARAAGEPPGWDASRAVGRRLLVGLVCLVVAGLLLMTTSTVAALAAFVAAAVGPDVWLSRRARARQERLGQQVPDLLEVLTLVLDAGLGLPAALARAAQVLPDPVARELRVVVSQIDVGRGLAAALTDLAARNPAPGLQRLTATLTDALATGTALVPSLHAMASDLRSERVRGARRRAARNSIAIVLVATFVQFPAIVLLVGGMLVLGGVLDRLGG